MVYRSRDLGWEEMHASAQTGEQSGWFLSTPVSFSDLRGLIVRGIDRELWKASVDRVWKHMNETQIQQVRSKGGNLRLVCNLNDGFFALDSHVVSQSSHFQSIMGND